MSESSEWSELSVSELKDSLRERGMPVSGRKEDLVRRLEENSVFRLKLLIFHLIRDSENY